MHSKDENFAGRKLVLIMHVSLDGFTARADGTWTGYSLYYTNEV